MWCVLTWSLFVVAEAGYAHVVLPHPRHPAATAAAAVVAPAAAATAAALYLNKENMLLFSMPGAAKTLWSSVVVCGRLWAIAWFDQIRYDLPHKESDPTPPLHCIYTV